MCDPVSAVVGVGMAAAQMAAQGHAQVKAAKAQNKYRSEMSVAQAKAYGETVESVRSDIGLQTDALFAQRMQQIDAQKQELQNITRDSRQASSSYRAITAETGVEGKTVDMVHQQFQRDVLEFESAAIRNISNMTAQVNREAQAIYSRGQNIINQGYPAPLPPPASVDWGTIAMSGISTGLSTGLTMYSAFKKPEVGSPGTGPA
jgi:hypothetical protein